MSGSAVEQGRAVAGESPFEDPWVQDGPMSFTSKRRESHVKKDPQPMKIFSRLTPKGNGAGGPFGRRSSKANLDGDADATGAPSPKTSGHSILRRIRSGNSTECGETPSSPSK